MIRLLSALALIFSCINISAETCVSKEEMQEIANHFNQFEPYAEKQYCLDGSEISNLLESLLYMKKTFFESPMDVSSDELFSGRFKDDWYGYFTERISEIEIDDGCPKGVGAYVYGFWGSKMYVCTMLLAKDFTALDRASVFMHEARHIDGYPHTTCHSGPRAGIRGACDSRISDGGSYAVSVETYAQIAKYATEVHPALRAYSKAAAVTYADEAFVTPAQVDRVEGIIALSTDQNFYKLTKVAAGEFKADKIGKAPSLGTITMRAQQLILFPTDKSKTAGYVFPKGEGQISQQAGEVPRRYNSMEPSEREQVIDSHIAGQWTAQVFQNKLEFSCDYRSDRLTQVSLPSGKEPLAFIYPEGYNRAHPTLKVSFADGSVFEAGCENTQSAFLRDTGLVSEVPLKRVHKVKGLSLGVDLSGNLYEVENGQIKPVRVIGGLDQIFELAPYSNFNFFDL